MSYTDPYQVKAHSGDEIQVGQTIAVNGTETAATVRDFYGCEFQRVTVTARSDLRPYGVPPSGYYTLSDGTCIVRSQRRMLMASTN